MKTNQDQDFSRILESAVVASSAGLIATVAVIIFVALVGTRQERPHV